MIPKISTIVRTFQLANFPAQSIKKHDRSILFGAGQERAKLSIDDIDVFEVNEAFAPVPLAWSRETKAALEKTNPNGGAIALGHPLGATGAILMTKLVHELERTGARFGLQTMCEGGGLANATVVERVD
jgi:acetyl-CoA C-acetyltransferase